MNGGSTMLRLAGGCLGLVLVAVLGVAVLAATVQFPWSAQHYSDLNGRTPETFAAACDDLDATLTEVVDRGDDWFSSCTSSSGHSIRCDWDPLVQRCDVECEGSTTIVDLVRRQGDGGSRTECDALKFLAYVGPGQRAATPPAAADSPPTEPAVNAGS